MAVTAALLATAVCAVHWRRPHAEAPAPEAAARQEAFVPVLPAYAPPEGSLLSAQLEVDQTFYVQTATAKYVLTLRDPVCGLYDATRQGLRKDGTIASETFIMIFKGTHVPLQGLRFGEFIPGGQMCYRKLRGGKALDVTPSSPIQRVFYCVSEGYRRAS